MMAAGQGPFTKKNYEIRTEKKGARVRSGPRRQQPPWVPWPFRSKVLRSLWPWQPLGQEGTCSSQRIQEAAGQRSQAYLLGPLGGVYRCCV